MDNKIDVLATIAQKLDTEGLRAAYEYVKGTTLITKKSIDCQAIIFKHSKDFGGSLEYPDVIKLCGCSRSSYYKYKRELKIQSS